MTPDPDSEPLTDAIDGELSLEVLDTVSGGVDWFPPDFSANITFN